MRIQFSDGVEFDTEGALRIEEREDGLYVVGGGMLCPVESHEEAAELIASMSKRTKGASHE